MNLLVLCQIIYVFVTPPSTERYKEKIAYIESRGDYCATNGDHFGKYQFSMETIQGLIRIKLLEAPCEGLTVDNFLNNPAYQERTMNAHIHHQSQLMKGFYRYKGKTIRGVKITVERLYAGMHFVGPTSLRHFLRTGSLKPHGKYIKVDRNGTTVIKYMKMI